MSRGNPDVLGRSKKLSLSETETSTKRELNDKQRNKGKRSEPGLLPVGPRSVFLCQGVSGFEMIVPQDACSNHMACLGKNKTEHPLINRHIRADICRRGCVLRSHGNSIPGAATAGVRDRELEQAGDALG